MNTIESIKRINEAELQSGAALNLNASWHAKYLKSAWVYVGNLDVQLTEGDILCILSQFGEIEDLNLVRDEETGKSRGFAFVKYEDAKSCVLAVDNFAGSKILGRSIRVDHMEKYRLPKHLLDQEEQQKQEIQDKELQKYQREESRGGESGILIHTDAGHAYQNQEIKGPYDIHSGQDLFEGPATPKTQTTASNTTDIEQDEAKRREEKQLRKKERARIRREREERRQKRQELRRKKRAQTWDDDHDSRDDGNNDKHGRDERKRSRKHNRTRSREYRRRDDRSDSDSR